MSLFLYDKTLSAGLTLALMAALVLCQFTTQNEDFAAVSSAGFLRRVFFTLQLSHFFLSPGLQEKNLLCFTWVNSVCCLNWD